MTKAEALAAIKKADDSAPTAHDKALTSAILPFAHLLNILATEADRTADKNLRIAEDGLKLADKNIKMQDRVLFISAILLVLTILQVGLAVSDYGARINNKPQGPNQKNELHQPDPQLKTK